MNLNRFMLSLFPRKLRNFSLNLLRNFKIGISVKYQLNKTMNINRYFIQFHMSMSFPAAYKTVPLEHESTATHSCMRAYCDLSVFQRARQGYTHWCYYNEQIVDIKVTRAVSLCLLIFCRHRYKMYVMRYYNDRHLGPRSRYCCDTRY